MAGLHAKVSKERRLHRRVAMVIALSLMRQSEGRKIQEEETSVVKCMFSEEITEGRAQRSPLFLCIALLAVIGALSLAMMVWFCGVKVMKMGQNMLAVRMSKENEALKKKIDEDEVENKNLKRINGLLRDENEKLKKVIESMKTSEQTRKAVISEMENGKLSALQGENVIQSLEKMKLWVTPLQKDDTHRIEKCTDAIQAHVVIAKRRDRCFSSMDAPSQVDIEHDQPGKGDLGLITNITTC